MNYLNKDRLTSGLTDIKSFVYLDRLTADLHMNFKSLALRKIGAWTSVVQVKEIWQIFSLRLSIKGFRKLIQNICFIFSSENALSDCVFYLLPELLLYNWNFIEGGIG